MSPDDQDPFAGLPIPPLPAKLIRECSYALAGFVVACLYDRRNSCRESKLRSLQAWRESPRGIIESERQRQLDRLTDENVHEVREQLKELTRRDEDLHLQERRISSRTGRYVDAMDRLGGIAWGIAHEHDEALAHRWEQAYRGIMPAEVQADLESRGVLESDWHTRHVGAQMLISAGRRDAASESLFRRVRDLLIRRGPDAIEPI